MLKLKPKSQATSYQLPATNSHGFTLIELLVVMVIIGLLSGLILPNLMSARERARDARRKSDLEQIQRALELYKMDQNPSAYPPSLDFNSSDFCGECWSSDANCAGNVYMKTVPCDPKSPDGGAKALMAEQAMSIIMLILATAVIP